MDEAAAGGVVTILATGARENWILWFRFGSSDRIQR